MGTRFSNTTILQTREKITSDSRIYPNVGEIKRIYAAFFVIFERHLAIHQPLPTPAPAIRFTALGSLAGRTICRMV